MVFADPRGHISILPHHLADCATTARQHAGVAVIAGRGFGDDAGGGGVVAAPGDERARAGLQSEVVWKRLYRSPSPASF